jgi:hypothetical protein
MTLNDEKQIVIDSIVGEMLKESKNNSETTSEMLSKINKFIEKIIISDF